MKKLRITLLLTILLSLFLFISCTSDNEPIDQAIPTVDPVTPAETIGLPIITTKASFTDELTSSPKLGGTITSDGGSPITASGIVWSTTTNPTIANSKTNDNTSVGNFTSTMTGLSPKTTYYVRAYATNSKGTSYGIERTITTIDSTIDNALALMTANIDNVQYNVMRPYLYAFTGNDVNVQNDGGAIGDPRFLWIQGDTSDNLDTLIEINLHIPNDKWTPGTYTLYEREDLSTTAECQAHLILNDGNFSMITSGTLTVTEFNLTTKRIKGTFSFTYSKSETPGDFKVTNGTFNYALDDSYFD
ncbi:hypothetical protein [Flavobacterium taihuense]|uniref:Fibronectin type-III domain-containing protein n=1 Tax=Flavobacterium taihuense TaxID=2857508 RepID=A0ABS6XXC3_9FLAO|nr:hypothetical protein [Flavobacterium taihuense]MBW4360916.1 hypothetical protein [Flavobacterium taihuense]